MAKVIVIADDLTGANATGVLIKNAGYETITIMNYENITENQIKDYDCIMFPTDSRGMDKNSAYKVVSNAINFFANDKVVHYGKRIDSTLRGNIGSETDAMLDFLGEDYVNAFVPSFPSAKRISVGGLLLVDNVLLQKTGAANDPKCPINTSIIENIIKPQSKFQTKYFFLNEIYDNKENVINTIKKFKENGFRNFIFDASCEADLQLIAEIFLESKIKFISVDPGPFTKCVIEKKIKKQVEYCEKKILLSIGTVVDIARIQLEEFLSEKNVAASKISVEQIVYGDCQKEIERVINEVKSQINTHKYILVVLDSIFKHNRIDFKNAAEHFNCSEEDISKKVNAAISEITIQILLEFQEIKGLFSSGGDITVQTISMLGSSGLELLDEVLPLIAFGKLKGGKLDGLKIVTKGGLVGTKNTLIEAIEFLDDKI